MTPASVCSCRPCEADELLQARLRLHAGRLPVGRFGLAPAGFVLVDREVFQVEQLPHFDLTRAVRQPACGPAICSTVRKQRLAHSTASSRESALMIQYPPITSLASAKGPSVTVGLPPRNLNLDALRARVEPLGCQQGARIDQCLVVLAHRLEKLLIGQRARLGLLVVLDHHHETHLNTSLLLLVLALHY